MAERGAAPEGDRQTWRSLRKHGDIEAASEYQRRTGIRSRNSPPNTTNAVVLNLFVARWFFYGPILVALVTVGVVTILNWPPSLTLVLGALVLSQVLPVLFGAYMLSPWAAPARVAFEGSNIWWQRFGHRWEGPARLDRTEGVAAYFKGSQRSSSGGRGGPFALGLVLVGDEFSSSLRGDAPSDVRRWVGDRHHLDLLIFLRFSDLPYRGIAREVLDRLPADVQMMPGTAELLGEHGFQPPHTVG